MKKEEIRIAIAETVGWHPHPDNHRREQKFWTYGGTGYGLPVGKAKPCAAMPPIYDSDSVWGDTPPLPDYCNNLNAMHEAEKVLTEKQWNKYVVVLARTIANQFDPNVKVSVPTNVLIAATAEQRAEALLRTLNLWKN